MSTTIDNRVVEMEFDNQNFEKNVKTSMGTIDKLKKSLRFEDSVKSLDNLEKKAGNISFGALASGIETVTNKISALEVVGITTIAKYTDKILDSGERLVKSLSIDQVNAGWSKYEQKTANVQTLMNATGLSIDKVNGYLAKLMQFSDETSYGFTDMTAALGQMAASGGDVEKLVPLITGVANATAYAGKGAAEFSRVMYNLNQSYGAGSLQLMDWKSVELAGVASKQLKEELIAAGEALGTIEKGDVTLANFSETLKKKWATTEVMEKAFGRFSEFSDAVLAAVNSKQYDTASDAIADMAKDYDELSVTAFKAAQEAKSFSEAIDATKDAVSSGWLQTFEIIFGDYEQAKVLWTDLANTLWDMFAAGAEARNEFISTVMGDQYVGATVGQWNKFAKSISLTSDELDIFQDALKTTAKDHGIYVDEIINAFDESAGEVADFSTSMMQSWLSYDIMSETIKKFADACDDSNKSVQELSRAELKNLGYTEQQINAIGEWVKTAEEAGTPLNELMDLIDRPPGRDLLIESFFNTLEAINTIIGQIKSSWRNVFPKLTESRVYDLILAFTKLTRKMIPSEEALTKLDRAFTGVFSVVKLLADILGTVFSEALNTVKMIFEELNINVLDVAAGFGDSLSAMTKWINENSKFKEVIKKVSSSIVSLVTNVVRLIGEFKELPETEKMMVSFGDTTEKVFTKVKEWYTLAKDSVVNFFSSFKDIDNIHASDILEALTGIKNNLSTIFNDLIPKIPESDTGIGSVFTKVKDSIVSAGEGIKFACDFVIGVLTDVKERMSNSTIVGNALAISVAIAILKMTQTIGSIIAAGVKVIVAAVDILTGAASLLTSISALGKQIAKAVADQRKIAKIRAYADLSIQLAEAVVILIGAWTALTYLIDNRANAGKAFLWLAGFMALLGGLAIAIGVASKIAGSNTGGLYASVLSISAGVAILVLCFERLSKIDSEKVGTAVKGMITAVAGLGILALVISLVAGKLTAAMPGLVSISLAVLSLTSAMLLLSFIDLEKVTSSIGLATTIFGGLLGLELASSSMGKKAGDSLLKMAASFLVIAIALKVFSAMNPDTIIDGIVKILEVLITVVAPMLLLSRLSGSIKNGYTKNGISGVLLGIAASLIAIAVAMKIMQTIPTDSIMESVKAIAIIIVAFSAPILAARKTGKYAFAATPIVIAMAGAVLAMAVALIALSFIKWQDLVAPIIGISAIIAGLSVAIAQAGKISSWSSTGAIAAISALMLSITLLFYAITNVKDIKKAALAVAGITGIFIALGVMLERISGSRFRLGDVGIFLTAAFMVSLMGGIVIALSHLVGDADKALISTLTISIMMVVMTGVVEVINKLPITNVGTVITGILTIVASLAIVVLSLAGIGNLITYLDLLNGLDTMIEVFRKLGQMLGEFVGGIFGGFKAGQVKAMFGVFEEIEISEKAQNNISSFSSLIDSLKDLSDAIPTVGGIFSFITGDKSLKTFAEQLKTFTETINDISVNPITETKIKTVGNCGKVLSEFIKSMPNIGGLKGIISGDLHLDILGQQIALFATSIKDIDPVGLSEQKMKTVNSCGMAISEFVNSMPKMKGFASYFAGDLHLDILGQQIAGFANSIKDIDPTGLSEDTMKTVSACGMAISEFVNSMPKTGGAIKTLFAGDLDLAKIGEDLVVFGKSMVSFAEATVGLDDKSVEGPVSAGKVIAGLEKELPNSAGKLKTIFGGQQTLGEFATNIQEFGRGINKFYSKTKDIEPTQIEQVAESTKSMVDITVTLSKIKDTIFTSSSNLEIFGTQLEYFGASFLEFANTVNGISDVGKVDRVVKSMGKMFDVLKGVSDLGDSVQNATDFASLLNDIASTGLEYFLDVFADCDEAVNNAISHMFDVIKSTMDTEQNNIRNSVQTIITRIVNGVNSRFSEFYNAGSNAISYFISGMNNRSGDVSRTASNLAAIASSAMNKTRSVSTNTAFTETANNAGESFVNALNSYATESQDSARTIGDNAIYGLQNSIDNINSILNSDDSFRPKITPIIDTSNIRGTMSSINGYMNQNASVNLSAINGRMGALNAMTDSINLNNIQSNSDVVDAINSLKEDIRNTNSAISNMKLVMNNGVLVGEIAGGIDTALGTRSMRAIRERI